MPSTAMRAPFGETAGDEAPVVEGIVATPDGSKVSRTPSSSNTTLPFPPGNAAEAGSQAMTATTMPARAEANVLTDRPYSGVSVGSKAHQPGVPASTSSSRGAFKV